MSGSGFSHPGPAAAAAALLLSWAALPGCGPTVYEPTLLSPSQVPVTAEDDAVLKVHMQNGDLYALRWWTPPPPEDTRLEGSGHLYDPGRNLLETGTFHIPRDSIALLETNRKETVGKLGTGVLTTWTVLTGAVTASCLADPKSCFGSCPTFYVEDDDDRPVAEGFSASFARILESTDLDALGISTTPGRPVSILMRNEALETHAVRGVRVLAVPVGAGQRVMATAAGEFYRTWSPRGPDRCDGSGGSCVEALSSMDDEEYAPRTDSTDLAAREILELAFRDPGGTVGLMVGGRQSFVSTFLFYQALAFAGSRAGEFMAALERGDPVLKERATAMIDLVGTVQVEMWTEYGGWTPIGEFGEPGPIATDRQVIPLELDPRREAGGDLHIRLRMARGAWRLDQVALARTEAGPVAGQSLELTRVRAESPMLEPPPGGEDPSAWALRALRDPETHLVTGPGDSFRLFFEAPEPVSDTERFDLFLESTGYYYEWMRGEWLEEEDPRMVTLGLFAPDEALRELAPRFKVMEARMEEMFWASRYRRSK